jgi:hypothetical protein
MYVFSAVYPAQGAHLGRTYRAKHVAENAQASLRTMRWSMAILSKPF